MDQSRRSLLKGAAGAAAFSALSPFIRMASLSASVAGVALSTRARASSSSVASVVAENALPGTLDWRLGALINGTQFFRSDDEKNQIVGYASKASVTPGDALDLHISINSLSPNYTIDIFRLGYYQGFGARFIQTIHKSNGAKQISDDHSNLIVDSLTGRVECAWAVSHTLSIGADWPTGIYLARLTNADRYQGHIVFCVRPVELAKNRLLYVQPTLTYQAYNGYPFVSSSRFKYPRVGRSLYPVPTISCATSPNPVTGNCGGVAVSYDRPYTSLGSYVGNVGNGAAFDSYTYEPYFIRWAEENGYALDYVTDLDIDQQGISLLERYQGIVFPGHFEYWTKNIRDAIEQARNQSVHLAFLGANAAYYQVRLEDSSSKVAGRTVVCYKGAAGADGKLGDPLANTLFGATNFETAARFDALMTGVGHAISGTGSQIFPLKLVNANHWVWSGTGAVEGSSIGSLLGYEVDVKTVLPFCKPNSYALLCDSSYLGHSSNASIYQAYSGGWVFAAGTMSWCWGLSSPITYNDQLPAFSGKTIPATYQSPIICKATKNLLDTFLADTADRRRRSAVAFALSNRSLWVREMVGGSWQPPLPLGGATVFEPSLLSRTNGDIDVAVTSARARLWVRSRRSGQWQPWLPLSGDNEIVGSPSVALARGGGVDVFALDNQARYIKRSYFEQNWTSWEVIGEHFTQPPAVVSCGDISEVFGIGAKRELLTTTIVNGVAGLGWTSLGGEVETGKCGVAAEGGGMLLAAVVGTEGRLWIRTRSASTGKWSAWFCLGETLTATPIVVSPYPGRFDVIAKLKNGDIGSITYTNGHWSAWTYHGGTITDEPKVTVTHDAIAVHGMGTDTGRPMWGLSIPIASIGTQGQWNRVF